jgi:hypothetical protein
MEKVFEEAMTKELNESPELSMTLIRIKENDLVKEFSIADGIDYLNSGCVKEAIIDVIEPKELSDELTDVFIEGDPLMRKYKDYGVNTKAEKRWKYNFDQPSK